MMEQLSGGNAIFIDKTHLDYKNDHFSHMIYICVKISRNTKNTSAIFGSER